MRHVACSLLAVVLLLVTLQACGPASDHFEPGENGCEGQAPPEGAFAATTSTNGFSGDTSRFSFFPDGSIVVEDSEGTTTRQLAGGAEAAAALQVELVATEVFEADQGCYRLEDPCCDTGYGSLSLRRDGEVFFFEGDAPLPDEVREAKRLLLARADSAT